MNDECAWRCPTSENTQVANTTGTPAETSTADAFCNPLMKTDMYMQGFTSTAKEDRACVVLFFRAWVLDSRIKFAAACVGVCLLGMLTQALIRLRFVVQKATGNNRMVISLMFGLNAVVGWFLMLVAMTYSMELFACATVGLILGHFVFADSDSTQILGSPCCNAVNDNNGGRDCCKTAPEQPTHSTVIVRVVGMTCSSCSKTVENAVKSIPGAVSCLVSVQDGLAVVRLRSPPASTASILEAIEAVGFEAKYENLQPYPTILQNPATAHRSKTPEGSALP